MLRPCFVHCYLRLFHVALILFGGGNCLRGNRHAWLLCGLGIVCEKLCGGNCQGGNSPGGSCPVMVCTVYFQLMVIQDHKLF